MQPTYLYLNQFLKTLIVNFVRLTFRLKTFLKSFLQYKYCAMTIFMNILY